jgi:L-threonylcarbamoyladenylate synthase
VLREGSITREDLGLAATDGASPDRLAASPGTRYRHYAPDCEIELVAPGEGPARARLLAAEGRRVGLVARGAAPDGVDELGRFDDASELARGLYAALRAAELAAVDVLVVESVPERGVGRAVMDRLRRAALAG